MFSPRASANAWIRWVASTLIRSGLSVMVKSLLWITLPSCAKNEPKLGEISATIAERVLPIVIAPYAGDDWRAHIRELARRRVRVFETMLPFRLAANIKRYQSPFLMGQYGQVVTIERELVLRLLPGEVNGDLYFVEALCAALSFQNWRAIRPGRIWSWRTIRPG